jgi:hypothetical protein
MARQAQRELVDHMLHTAKRASIVSEAKQGAPPRIVEENVKGT